MKGAPDIPAVILLVYRRPELTSESRAAIRPPRLGQGAVAVCGLAILLMGTVWAADLKVFSDQRARDLYAVSREPPVEQIARPPIETGFQAD